MSTAVEIMMSAASITMLDVSSGLQTHSKEQRRTQHTLSAGVAMALVLRLLRKSDYRTGTLARGIAATKRRTFFDSRGELGGEGSVVEDPDDEAATSCRG